MKNLIEVKNIKKNYGKKEAVKGISFNVEENEILGLLGPNGSGKTTTIGMLLGLLKPTSGQIFINNLRLEENRIQILEMINFISPYIELPKKLTVKQNLYVYSRNIANSSSLWLAGNINTPEPSGKALYIKYSQSSLLKKINNNHWVLPNLQFGLMPSNNLMLSGNFFGMHLKKDILQISGGGIHYLGGENQDWVVAFQKSALNGLNDFRLVSTSLSVNKRVKKSFY